MGEEYKNSSDLLGTKVTLLLSELVRLSEACVNFSYAAVNVSNINVTETHEIKELLELVFDIRKLSEKTLDIIEDRLEKVLKKVNEEEDD